MLKQPKVAVVVLGEIARSPRVLNHARELARNGFEVVLIGYGGRDFIVPEGVRVAAIDGGRGAPAGQRGIRFILSAGLRMMRLLRNLVDVLLRENPETILVQNPPSFPTLTAAYMAANRSNARVVVDWHNYAYSLLALRLGAAHWLVQAARWYEFYAGRRASLHFCVSAAMQADLLAEAGIKAAVLYDRPLTTHADAARESGAPLKVVCPAGWTADEDMDLLVRALEMVDDSVRLEVFATGDGPGRQGLRVDGRLRLTGYLAESDYRQLLSEADLGLSLHRSSSDLDLAMKVIDLFGYGVPVCAFDYGGAIGEQIEAGVTGFLFRDAEELSAMLSRLAADRRELRGMRRAVRERWNTSWSLAWHEVVLPKLDDPGSIVRT